MNQNQTESKPPSVEEPRDKGLDETACSALLAAGFKPYRPDHKVGAMSQNLSNVRDLNKYYRTQTAWWISPSGEIVNWEQALNSLPNDQVEARRE
jgi:hypothetical protein